MKILLDSPVEKLSMPMIVTLTWYEGDVASAAVYLQTRSRQVLDHNPWLGGRLEKERKGLALVYDERAPDTKVHVVQQPSLDRSTPVSELHAAVKHHLTTVGRHNLWQITLIDTGNGHFALLFALVHEIADSHVYYRLLSMLCDETIESLNLERAFTEEECKELIGYNESPQMVWQHLMCYLIFTMVKAVVVKAIGFCFLLMRVGLMLPPDEKPTPTGSYYASFLIDNESMTEMKETAAKEGQINFCSTNDVISSWVYNALRPVVAVMMVDCRQRLEWAGGRTGRQCIIGHMLFAPDYTHPSLIREAVTTLRRPVTKNDQAPGLWRLLTIGRPFVVVTNWSKFSKRPRPIPGCDELAHLPVKGLDLAAYVDQVTVLVYAPRPSETAVCVIAAPQHIAQLQNGPFTGATL